jgi:DNA topoisomerase I
MKDLSGGEENLNYEKYHKPEKCPECGSKMVLKNGRYGKFWACETYPECKGIVSLLLNEKCPECDHHLVERRGKWGKTFTGCSNYPNCKYIKKVKTKKKKEEES